MIKVVVVDDSAFMRKAISTMLEKDSDIKVVGLGRNGEEGLELIRQHQPDVVTMDIEMPKMDGLTALRHIMTENPLPVLMVSSLTTEGAEATLKAMELGAVDYISKQLSKVSLDIVNIEENLKAKVHAVAKRKLRRPSPQVLAATRTISEPSTPRIEKQKGAQLRDVVAIGVSTGGPPAVQKVLSELPSDFPAGIIIAQHMPKAFTGPFAKRLDTVCKIKVKEAEHGERFQPGVAYVAQGGTHLRIDQRISRIDIIITDEPKDAIYKPSANVLISSAAQAVGKRALGVILTGMGSDGLEGVRELKGKGGKALAQSDSSCVVYGMPKAIVDAKLADEIIDIDDMSQAIMNGLYR